MTEIRQKEEAKRFLDLNQSHEEDKTLVKKVTNAAPMSLLKQNPGSGDESSPLNTEDPIKSDNEDQSQDPVKSEHEDQSFITQKVEDQSYRSHDSVQKQEAISMPSDRESYDNEIERLQAELNDRDAQMTQLRESLSETELKLANTEEELERAVFENAELRTTLSHGDDSLQLDPQDMRQQTTSIRIIPASPSPPKQKKVPLDIPMQKESYWSAVEDSHRSMSSKIEELTNTKDLWLYKSNKI